MLGRHRAFNRNDLKLGLTDWAYNIDSHNNWLAASVMFRLGKIESGTRLHFSQLQQRQEKGPHLVEGSSKNAGHEGSAAGFRRSKATFRKNWNFDLARSVVPRRANSEIESVFFRAT
jgi:hypothetical protein